MFHGSIAGPLLFNIYINDLFFFTEEFLMSNYADDNSPFEIGCNANEVIKKFEDAIILIQWFTNNFLKPNPSKWHLLLSDINNEHCISISNQNISNSETEKFVGINSISFLAPKIWNAIPTEIRGSSSLHIFKKHINKWIPEACPCKLCKTYISNLGFI